MIVLVTGGASSGKSDFAEKICTELAAKHRCYVATMQYNPQDNEAVARIKRHCAKRLDHGFDTVESPTNLAGLDFAGYDVVLLECLGNLLANEMFAVAQSAKAAEAAVKSGIINLIKTVPDVVIVANEVFSDGENYSNETMEYIALLGNISVWLTAMADEVYEVVCGIPLKIKAVGR